MRQKTLLSKLMLLLFMLVGASTVLADDFTWNLATNSYLSASETSVVWDNDYATMELSKGNSTTKANNYLGGSSNYTHTRFYAGQLLTITPKTGYTVTSVVFTATGANYVGVGGTWTNAFVSVNNTTATVTPTNGQNPFSVGPSGARITSVKVNYTSGSITIPSLSLSPASINFGDNEINDSYEESFNVTFANLTQDLSVSLGSGLTGVSVSPTTITKNATSPQTVTVTYAPTSVGNISGNITVSNTEDNVSEIVTVTGSAYDPSNVDTYEKYSGAIVEGDYVIYNSNGAMKNSISSNRFENGTVTISGTTITNPDKSVVWHIAPIANTDYWTIYNADAAKYAGGTSTKNQGALLAEVTDLAKWIITYQNSNYTIENYGRSQASTDNTNKYLRQNSTNGWATYASGTGSVPQLYKKVVTNQVAQPTFSVAAGTYYETQNVTISCETQDATIYYTTDGSTPSSSNGTLYSTAISVSTTTTIKAIAVKSGMTDSDVATVTYTIEQPYSTIPALFAAATATEKDVRVTFDNCVVSGVSTNGKTVYVTDNNGNGFIIYFTSDMSGTFEKGKVLSGTAVACKLKLFNGAAELVNLNANDLTITTGGNVTAVDIAMANLSGVNTGALVSYENLTCSISDNKYYLTDGTTTIQVYNTLFVFDALENGKTYNITGVYVQYNNTKEIAPRSSADIVEVVAPSITVNPATANPAASDVEGTLAISYENLNITGMTDFDIQFCDSEGADASKPNWVDDVCVAEEEGNTGNYVVSYVIKENNGDARSAYFKVYAMDEQTNLVYSNLVTITQDAYVVPPTPNNWVSTNLADINANDVFVIVGDNGNNYAMSNDNSTTSAPSAVSVTVVGNALSGTVQSNCKWNIGHDDAGYIFYPNGTTESWLYCTNTNNGVRVGTGDAKHFNQEDGYLTTTETTDQRFIGIYNSADWRCYKKTAQGEIAANISGQTFTFYKQLAAKLNNSGYATFSATVPVDFSQATDFTAWAITEITGTNITFSQITGAVPANTGVLLKGTAGETIYPTIATSGTAPATNLLEGISTATVVAGNAYYGLSGNTFVKVNEGTVPAGKALLPASVVNNVSGNARLSFVFEGEDTTTGISTMHNSEFIMHNEVYNLNGQRVNDMKKGGLYIMNGKKVIVK